VAVVQGSSSHF